MEFAGFDDDLFHEDRQRSCVVEDYLARKCENCWFLQVPPQDLVSTEDELASLKYTADYLFLSGAYDDAVGKYEELLSVLAPSNTVTKRECLEGLTRCHIRRGKPDDAVTYAEKLHQTSKNTDQRTVSCSVLVEAYLAAGRYSDALGPAQTLVTLHAENCHTWIKLCYVYACIYSISLPEVEELISAHLSAEGAAAVTRKKTKSCLSVTARIPGDIELSGVETHSLSSGDTLVEASQLNSSGTFSDGFASESSTRVEDSRVTACPTASKSDKVLENNRLPCQNDGVQYVAACLHRANVILQKTQGTAVGFALESNLMYQNKLQQDLRTLLDDDSLTQLKMQVVQNNGCSSVCSSKVEDNAEFVDLGSSKFKPENDVDDDGVEVISQNKFECQWFAWIKV